MDLAMSIFNVLFFLIGCAIVLRIYFSNRRIERVIAAIHAKLMEEEVKRTRHAELMAVELNAMERSREELRAQVLECRTHLEELNSKGGINGD